MKKANNDPTDHVWNIFEELFSENPRWDRLADQFYFLMKDPEFYSLEGIDADIQSQFN